MTRRYAWPLAAVGLICLAMPVRAEQAAAENTSLGTPSVLPNGARFTVPKGWTTRESGSAIILAAPDGTSQIAIGDGGAADTADAAVAAVWAAYRPDHPAAIPGTDRPAREGWDQTRLYRYESPPGEPRNRYALALRKGDRWTVLINDMTVATAEQRDAQLEVIFNTLLPPGYARETFAGRKAHPLDAARIAQLSELIETGRKELDIPGVALGLIDRGKIVFEGGFGVRELGQSTPVDARTLFNIASNGKALTTLMLAKEVEAGRFRWDTPVASAWPQFRLGDDETTRRVEVKHLVCACTGMRRQDYEWLLDGGRYTPAGMMQLLSTTKPTTGFGETYQYSNLMASAAGYFGGHVRYPRREPGAAYDAAMQRLVFDPLGMTATTADFDRALKGNHATGHARDVDGAIRTTDQGINLAGLSTRPSGNHWSNVRDLLRYVRMELAKGRLPDGRRYIREDVLLARRVPQVVEGRDEYYGMGLKIDRQWGVEVIHHGGTMIGYRSDMIWLPDHGVGAVILINADTGAPLRTALRRRLLEVLFDGRPVAVEQLKAQAQRARAAVAEERASLAVPADAAAVEKLAAKYRNAQLGTLEVHRTSGATRFDFGEWSSDVATRAGKDGSVTFVTITPGNGGFEFEVADEDGQQRLVLRDEREEYVFVPEGG